MKYGTTSTFKGKRFVKGHRKRMHGDHGKAKPSMVAYFSSLRWLRNKARRIAKDAARANGGVSRGKEKACA